MLRPRIIPCLLIQDKGLVKTVNFKNPKYVGDPINAVRIFNEKKVDELIVLDIEASRKGNEPNYELIKKLAAECRMPLSYGGGITNSDQAEKIFSLGVEKISLSNSAITNPRLISEIAKKVGEQSVVVVLDLKKKKFSSGYNIYTKNGIENSHVDYVQYIKSLQQLGAGELVINSIDRDGLMNGYDIGLVNKVRTLTTLPITVLGGAGNLSHMKELINLHKIIGCAAGSLFVFKGKFKAVLINYPDTETKLSLFLKHYESNSPTN